MAQDGYKHKKVHIGYGGRRTIRENSAHYSAKERIEPIIATSQTVCPGLLVLHLAVYDRISLGWADHPRVLRDHPRRSPLRRDSLDSPL